MRFNDIMVKADAMDINTSGMNKTEIIRAIQRTKDKICCYGTEWVDYCEKGPCLWKDDCCITGVQ